MKLVWFLFSILFSTVAGAEASFKISSSGTAFVCNASNSVRPSEEIPSGNITSTLTYTDLTQAENSQLRVRSGGYIYTATNTQIFSSTQQWLAQITDLNFSLSTEQMGAAYTVHVCYLGPVENKDKGKDQTEAIYSVVSSIYNTINEYTLAAQLYYRVSMKCDLRKDGTYKNARNDTTVAPESGIMEVDITYVSNWAPFDGSLRELSWNINPTKTEVPRFCEFQFQFKEGSTDLRPANLKFGDFNLGLDIE